MIAMAHLSSCADWMARLRCSYKSATYILCTGNVLMALFMLHAALAPVDFDATGSLAPGTRSSSTSSSSTGLDGRIVQTREELERIEDSNRMRRELLPFNLIERVKEIQEETELEINRTEALNSARQKVAAELSQRLRELKLSNSETTQKALEEWKKKKLEQRNNAAAPAVGGDGVVALDGRTSLGNFQNSNEDSIERIDMEHDTIPGRGVPAECHAEVHTDYGGAAVRWGLSHHVDSAADCCQACVDMARSETEEKKKCNIWVYCPQEGGCHSPDKYTHKHHECWLKQSDEPLINFKGHYDEEYRRQHPSAPSIVPWVSGVIS